MKFPHIISNVRMELMFNVSQSVAASTNRVNVMSDMIICCTTNVLSDKDMRHRDPTVDINTVQWYNR
jgi:hypothetical protein